MAKLPRIEVKTTRFERPANRGDAIVTFTAASGESVEVLLSPKAQAQLLSMLLASAKGRIVDGHFELTRPPLRARSFAAFSESAELNGLEIGLSDQAAVHVNFDLAAFQQLMSAVGQLAAPNVASDPGVPKH